MLASSYTGGRLYVTAILGFKDERGILAEVHMVLGEVKPSHEFVLDLDGWRYTPRTSNFVATKNWEGAG